MQFATTTTRSHLVDDEASEAMQLLGDRDLNQVPVLDGRALAGLVRREDILRWLTVHRVDDEGADYSM